MGDILETVAKHRQAEAAKQQEQKRAAALHASAKAKAKQKRLKVLGNFLIRVLFALAVVVGLWISLRFGLIESAFATPVICAVLMWASAWCGAYVQHRIGKEGLFK